MKPLHIAVTSLFVFAFVALAGGRRMQWSLDLSHFLKYETAAPIHVEALQFSPDETQLAIAYGPSWANESTEHEIIIVKLNAPKIPVHRLAIPVRLRYEHGLVWSPSGTVLIARTRTPVMFRLDDSRPPCEFPEESEFAGFLANDRLVVIPEPSAHITAIQILRPDCSLEDQWTIASRAVVLRTSPDLNRIAMLTDNELQVVDPVEHKAVQRWPSKARDVFAGVFFAAQAKRVCGAIEHPAADLPSVACWDIQTGALASENTKASVDLGGMESAGGDLLAITASKLHKREGKLWEYLDMNATWSSPSRRIIWNLVTGKEVVSWFDFSGGFRPKDRQDPNSKGRVLPTWIVMELSPSGKYLAEGDSRTVFVYELRP